MRRITLAVAALFVSGAALFAACAAGEPPPGDGDGVKAAVSSFALDAGCAQCAAASLAGDCKDELEACVQDQDCLDVVGCLAACDPNDNACFAQCAQASALFAELATCAMCDACGQECAGSWDGCNDGGQGGGGQGGGGQGGAVQGSGGGNQGSGGGNQGTGGGGTCDDTGNCDCCAQCAVDGDCHDEWEACEQDPGCEAFAQCYLDCGGVESCSDWCAQQDPNGQQTFDEVLNCVACACPDDCGAYIQCQ